jgi:predicted transcriptional regulator
MVNISQLLRLLLSMALHGSAQRNPSYRLRSANRRYVGNRVCAPIAAVNAPFHKTMKALIGRINCHRLTERYNWRNQSSPVLQAMTIVVSLPYELEAKLQARAERQGRDIAVVAAELLSDMLEWEENDTEEAIQGIQRGLDAFEAGQYRSFGDFAAEQRRKYDLPPSP